MRESLLLHSTNIVVYPNITIHGFYITLSHSQFSLFNFQGAFSMGVFCILEDWWAQVDSNHRPHADQAVALTTWAMSPFPVVEMRRSELLTPCVQGRCYPSRATPPIEGCALKNEQHPNLSPCTDQSNDLSAISP